MTVLNLRKGAASARVSTVGGSILRLCVNAIDLLRPADDLAAAIDSACYPLVPFGNRIRGNTFTFQGRLYQLRPNTKWDPHYLHGEGWLDEWEVERHQADMVTLRHEHDGTRIPYSYAATQTFELDVEGMSFRMSVTNTGTETMPFGIGWHPYFPMTPETTLQASLGRMWTEEEGWLSGQPGPKPDDLDFQIGRKLPDRWVNNAFESWCGEAIIKIPERNAIIRISADAALSTAFLFVSDKSFDAGYARDFFAFEPMSHLPDGHNQSDLGGLVSLEPGESFEGAMQIALQRG